MIFKNKIINYFVRKRFEEMSLKGMAGKNKETIDALWKFSGNLAEYFSERGSGVWDYNQDKIYYRLLSGFRNEIFKQ